MKAKTKKQKHLKLSNKFIQAKSEKVLNETFGAFSGSQGKRINFMPNKDEKPAMESRDTVQD